MTDTPVREASADECRAGLGPIQSKAELAGVIARIAKSRDGTLAHETFRRLNVTNTALWSDGDRSIHLR